MSELNTKMSKTPKYFYLQSPSNSIERPRHQLKRHPRFWLIRLIPHFPRPSFNFRKLPKNSNIVLLASPLVKLVVINHAELGTTGDEGVNSMVESIFVVVYGVPEGGATEDFKEGQPGEELCPGVL
jgi:hypothetical protein